MAEIPPEVYEQEYVCWPWGTLIKTAASWVCESAPLNGVVVDYMCSTGYLLNLICKARPDLRLYGCDRDSEYVDYGRRTYPRLNLAEADVFSYRPAFRPTVALCTGSLHHLSPADQGRFVAKVAAELSQSGYLAIGEELLPPFVDEPTRRRAVLRLYSRLFLDLVDLSPADTMLTQAIRVFTRDLLRQEEYKLSEEQLIALLRPHFDLVHRIQTWPHPAEDFGDILLVFRSR